MDTYEHEQYRMEEFDDSRTWEPSFLVPDCANEAEDVTSELVVVPGKACSERSIKTDEFWSAFERLLYACGQVSYYWHMVQNVGKEPFSRAKDIAEKYGRNIKYYREQKKAWVFEARRALTIWQLIAYEQGVKFHFEDNGDAFLNSLVDSDRRDCARRTVRYAKPKGKLLNPNEIEERYKAYLERSKKRKMKKGPSS